MNSVEDFLEKVSEELEKYIEENKDTNFVYDLVALKAHWERKTEEIRNKVDEDWDWNNDMMETPYDE